MRAFKKTWAELANPRTGYLEKGQLVPFLGVSYPYYIIDMRAMESDDDIRDLREFSK